MSLYLQLLSIATPYSSPCVVVCTENHRFIIDVGEGIQRLCMEHKIKLGKINSILITRICQDTLGGLPGLFLTAADSGLMSINFVGPNNLNKYWECMSNYVYRPKVNLTINNAPQIIETDEITVKSIPITKDNTNISYLFKTPELLGKFDLKKALDLNVPKGPLFAKLKRGESITLECGKVILPQDVLGPSKPSTAILIICNIDDINNNIDSLLLQNLIENSYFDEYKIGGIYSNQIECMVHLSSRSTISNENYINWIKQFSNITHICAGYHGISDETSYYSASLYCNKLNSMCPYSFVTLPMGSQCNIIDIFQCSDVSQFDCVVDDANNNIMVNMHSSTSKENVLIQAVPLMKYNITLCKSCNHKLIIPDVVKSLESEVTTFYNNYITNEEGCQRLKLQENLYKYVYNHDVQGSDDSVSQHVINMYDLHNKQVQYLSQYNDHEVYFLGTGCAVPSKYRNVSGILLRLKNADLLLDVGEASWHQLVRMEFQIYIKSNKNKHLNRQNSYDFSVYNVAKRLKLIWISHPHADHHLGLIKILEERKRVLEIHNEYNNDDKKIIVIAPISVIHALNKYHKNVSEYAKHSYIIINCQYFDPYDQLYTKSSEANRFTENEERNENNTITCKTVGGKSSYLPNVSYALQMLESIGISDLVNVQVQHCSQAYGVAITLKPLSDDMELIKIVYSGDTRPCDALISIGMNATILIHEATFEDKKIDDAIKKNHSTMAEAVNVGKQMNAFRVILTHFSQRYQKVPPIISHDIFGANNDNNSAIDTNSCNVILAFDFMHMTFLDILWLPSLSHILALAFPIDCEDSQEFDDTNLQDDSVAIEDDGNTKTKIIKL